MADAASLDPTWLKKSARLLRYGGNPEHKRYPADYALSPPASPRPGKTLCDVPNPVPRATALKLLREGFRRGLISPASMGEWPQNVWAQSDEGVCYEAQLENREQGSYHGYPMPRDDDFAEVVRREWVRRGR